MPWKILQLYIQVLIHEAQLHDTLKAETANMLLLDRFSDSMRLLADVTFHFRSERCLHTAASFLWFAALSITIPQTQLQKLY